MLGVAALPSLLARAGSAVSVHGARNSAGWGLFLLAIFLISAPAYAVFSKYIVLRGLLGQPVDLAPEWSQGLISKGLLVLNDQNQDSRLELAELAFARDGVMFFLPIAAEFPVIIATLTVSAVIGGALAGGAAQTVTIAAILSGDLYHRVLIRSASPASQVTAGRIAIGLTVICAIWLAINIDADGFRLFVWSLSLCASSIFPVLLLSIWWKKCSAPGALAGLLAGFATASGYIYSTEFLGQQLWFGIDPIAAAVFGAPAAGLAALSVSYLTPSKPQGDKTPTIPLMAGGGQGLYGGSQRSAAPGLGT